MKRLTLLLLLLLFPSAAHAVCPGGTFPKVFTATSAWQASNVPGTNWPPTFNPPSGCTTVKFAGTNLTVSNIYTAGDNMHNTSSVLLTFPPITPASGGRITQASLRFLYREMRPKPGGNQIAGIGYTLNTTCGQSTAKQPPGPFGQNAGTWNTSGLCANSGPCAGTATIPLTEPQTLVTTSALVLSLDGNPAVNPPGPTGEAGERFAVNADGLAVDGAGQPIPQIEACSDKPWTGGNTPVPNTPINTAIVRPTMTPILTPVAHRSPICSCPDGGDPTCP